MLSRVVCRGTTRSLSTTKPRSFLFFGKKEKKTQDEIIAKQDEFEVDPEAAITILNKANSPDTVPFNPETDMPKFLINQWKQITVAPKDIEATYTPDQVADVINSVYQELTQKPLTTVEHASTDLRDLQFRFKLVKLLQQKLGFDLNDYTVSQTHTVADLHEALSKVVSKRWVSERLPNAIVLRPEDFTAGNVYLNQELSPKQQQQKLTELVKQARAANE